MATRGTGTVVLEAVARGIGWVLKLVLYALVVVFGAILIVLFKPLR